MIESRPGSIKAIETEEKNTKNVTPTQSPKRRYDQVDLGREPHRERGVNSLVTLAFHQ